MVRKDIENVRREFRNQIVVLITGAFAFTAALFWNTAIKNAITHFIPAAESWYWDMLIAVVVTIIAVIATYLVAKFAERGEEKK
ncbi:TPA: hypothetical protein HA244_00595 [Candidatus Micrarchaeota archaeon]|nr:hypothetical protein [Candidatus Micrarchaeota archaeon]